MANSRDGSGKKYKRNLGDPVVPEGKEILKKQGNGGKPKGQKRLLEAKTEQFQQKN